MHQQHSPAYYTREQRFNDRFPLGIVAILAIIQMLTTFAILVLEIGHIIINIRLTNLFVGIWASIPFTILWISMFATVCCCRRRSCATHAVIQNFISLIFASALVGINIAFLRRPYHCFFSEGICYNLSWETELSLPFECFNDSSDTCENIRLSLIKAQLAAGAIMAATCLIYLILYCTISSRVSRAERRQIPPPGDAVMAPVYQQTAPAVINYQHQSFPNPPHLYQPSAPVMIPAFTNVPNPNYPHTGLYPQISNDRF